MLEEFIVACGRLQKADGNVRVYGACVCAELVCSAAWGILDGTCVVSYISERCGRILRKVHDEGDG